MSDTTEDRLKNMTPEEREAFGLINSLVLTSFQAANYPNNKSLDTELERAGSKVFALITKRKLTKDERLALGNL